MTKKYDYWVESASIYASFMQGTIVGRDSKEAMGFAMEKIRQAVVSVNLSLAHSDNTKGIVVRVDVTKIKLKFLNNVIDFSDTWTFVEENYPGYDHCNMIGDGDTLQKLIDGEFDENDEDDICCQYIKSHYEGSYADNIDAITREYKELHHEIYVKAINGFLINQE
jgi:hypothetical protein